MGHYSDSYDAERDRQLRLKAERLKRLKAEYPDDPSEWEISLEDRVKLLEERVLKLEMKNRRLK